MSPHLPSGPVSSHSWISSQRLREFGWHNQGMAGGIYVHWGRRALPGNLAQAPVPSLLLWPEERVLLNLRGRASVHSHLGSLGSANSVRHHLPLPQTVFH